MRRTPLGTGRRALVVAAILAACVPAPPPLVLEPPLTVADTAPIDELAAARVQRSAREFTVRIRSLGCDRLGLGSGFALADGLIVTNRHVVGQPRQVSIATWDGRSFEADVEGIALDADLAILRVPGADLPVAELRAEAIAVGELVAAIGYPGGGPATIATGTVLGRRTATLGGEATDVIVTDADVRQGNSGGPLVDTDGRVVGVVVALSVGDGYGLAIPVPDLVERLERRGFAPPDGCGR
jgi:S1-C subfamily serine protease